MAFWIEEIRYNPLCDADAESSSDMLSEESSNEMSESESESKTSVVACWWVGRCDSGQ
jgi:hypothetical protein